MSSGKNVTHVPCCTLDLPADDMGPAVLLEDGSHLFALVHREFHRLDNVLDREEVLGHLD